MFVNHRLAKIAAEKELQEAQARIDVQQQLSAAQAQAAQRAMVVAREKAANEAKSEFMSLMCHEVRTPLNGCLASAEMLLEMPLQVSVPLAFNLPPMFLTIAKNGFFASITNMQVSFACHTDLPIRRSACCQNCASRPAIVLVLLAVWSSGRD